MYIKPVATPLTSYCLLPYPQTTVLEDLLFDFLLTVGRFDEDINRFFDLHPTVIYLTSYVIRFMNYVSLHVGAIEPN